MRICTNEKDDFLEKVPKARNNWLRKEMTRELNRAFYGWLGVVFPMVFKFRMKNCHEYIISCLWMKPMPILKGYSKWKWWICVILGKLVGRIGKGVSNRHWYFWKWEEIGAATGTFHQIIGIKPFVLILFILKILIFLGYILSVFQFKKYKWWQSYWAYMPYRHAIQRIEKKEKAAYSVVHYYRTSARQMPYLR